LRSLDRRELLQVCLFWRLSLHAKLATRLWLDEGELPSADVGCSILGARPIAASKAARKNLPYFIDHYSDAEPTRRLEANLITHRSRSAIYFSRPNRQEFPFRVGEKMLLAP
jgi:hypothetical protein